jgi:hypothetical protein
MNAYPEHNWEAFKFAHFNYKCWDEYLLTLTNKKQYLQYLERELKISNEEDWKKVQKDDLKLLNMPSGWG